MTNWVSVAERRRPASLGLRPGAARDDKRESTGGGWLASWLLAGWLVGWLLVGPAWAGWIDYASAGVGAAGVGRRRRCSHR